MVEAGKRPSFAPSQVTARELRLASGIGAPRIFQSTAEPQPATTQMWWAGIAGMCYLPGTAAPIGLSPEGLPLSVQVVGPQHGDYSTIRFAQLIEREYYSFAAPPGFG